MAVSNELFRPDTEDEFEAMCHLLYRGIWNDTSCVRVGGVGQAQFGVDVLGNDGKQSVGIQCKHYNKKAFTLATVTDDVRKADEANLNIDHLLFATTAQNKSSVVLEVRRLSEERRKAGKFTVSVDFWEEISGHLRVQPQVAKAFIRNFPGTTLSQIKEISETHLALYIDERDQIQHFQAETLRLLSEIQISGRTSAEQAVAPSAKGDETDPVVAAKLDIIRDKLKEGKHLDAFEMLKALGDPSLLKDPYSRFRWHTNNAAVLLADGKEEDAARGFLEAYEIAPENEKALTNRVHAYLLLKNFQQGLEVCNEALAKYPAHASLWALWVNARMLLGEAEPDAGVPEEMLEQPDLLFTLSHVRQNQSHTGEALDLILKCLTNEPHSLDAKRAYLASALAWALEDPVRAHHGQLHSDQRNALTDAIERLEPLETTLPALQSENISRELTNNIVVALLILGDRERARLIAQTSLRRHPLSEGLLRLRLNELDERRDVASIHALTDSRLTELPRDILVILAEISANLGDLAWHNTLVTALASHQLDQRQQLDVQALSIHATWMTGKHADAIEAAKVQIAREPQHIFTRVMLSQMLRRNGHEAESKRETFLCAAHLDGGSPSFDVLQVADLLFDSDQHVEAAELYARLVGEPGADPLTHRLIMCLIESDQRSRVQDIFVALPTEVREKSSFRRAEANLARRMGDWARMGDLLKRELDKNPKDASLAVGYAGALLRQGEHSTLHAYLRSDPDFLKSAPEAEFEFAKYQAAQNLKGLAIRRLLRLFRKHPNSAQAASFYLLQLLISKGLAELESPLKTGYGVVVHLENERARRVIAIDIDDNSDISSWPELVSATSELGSALMDRKIGDNIILADAFGQAKFQITSIESLYAFAATKGHALIGATASPEGPLWSVQLAKDDGELDLEPILASLRNRSAFVKNVFAAYEAHRFPLSMVAKAVGSDPVTLLLEWPTSHSTLFVALGTYEERNSALQIIRESAAPYVLDLLTIAELVRWNVFEIATQVLGKLLVPQTAREQLLILIQLIDTPRASASLSENQGKYYFTETPPEYYETRKALLLHMLECIDSLCEVVPTVGPKVVTEHHRFLTEQLDPATLDVIYLCLERDAVLVSEDGGLRLIAPAAGVQTAIGIQPLLMWGIECGAMKKSSYAEIILGKLVRNHDFISVRAEDLVWAARSKPTRVSEQVKIAFDTFRKPSLDIVSGVRVGSEFLRDVTKHLPPKVVAAYCRVVLDVLQDGRQEFGAEIHRALAEPVEAMLEGLGGQRKAILNQSLRDFLNVPKQRVISPRRTTIARAVQAMLSQ